MSQRGGLRARNPAMRALHWQARRRRSGLLEPVAVAVAEHALDQGPHPGGTDPGDLAIRAPH